jgi:hypothetical protein
VVPNKLNVNLVANHNKEASVPHTGIDSLCMFVLLHDFIYTNWRTYIHAH